MSDDARHPASTDDATLFRRADDVFDAALDLAPGERRAYVERACAGDDALRAAVERLLRAHDRAGDFLERPAADVAASLLAESPPHFRHEHDDEALRDRLARALGPSYRLDACVGRGGMAIVYRAHDLRHDRFVAVKVIDPALGAALDGERADRFLREIRVTARLQHPNVVPLFDSGAAEGLLWYVMPFVEGETLRTRLRREAPLPVDEAVRIALGIGRALEHAHATGIVHRDLKPENVLLQAGEPVVADFGIALAVSHAGGSSAAESRVALGTPQYMSPEQASPEGSVDSRSDVYALGAVLYEMLTGAPPHAADSPQAILARRRTEPPVPVRSRRPDVPAPISDAVERALARDRAMRFTSVRELMTALASRHDADALGRPARMRRLAVVIAVASIVMAIVVTLVVRGRSADRAAAPARPSTFVITPPHGADTHTPVLSPDGTRLVYIGDVSMGRRLMVRPIGDLAATPLGGTEGATRAFASPDGRSIAFFTTDEQLKTIPITGGPVTSLTSAFRFAYATWGAGDRIVFSKLPGLAWISPRGGPPRQLTRFDTVRRESRHSVPLVLADGRTVFFTAERGRTGPVVADGDLAVATLDPDAATPAPHALLDLRVQGALAMVSDWLVYVAAGGTAIRAVRLDSTRRRLVGPPVTLLAPPGAGIVSPQLARDGTLLYSRHRRRNVPVVVDSSGTRTPIPSVASGSFMNPRLSPDGRRLVIQSASASRATDAWLFDVASPSRAPLTRLGTALNPTWTPDGKAVVYLSQANGSSSLWVQRADGRAAARRIIEADGLFAPEVTPDGRTVVFQRGSGRTLGIWAAPLDGGTPPRPIVVERFNAYMPAISPDGRSIAYAANPTGSYEIYVRPFPGPGAATKISDGGGTEPAWSHDGRRLYYRASRSMLAADLALRPTVVVNRRSTLFTGIFDDDDQPMPHRNYDVSADGRSFVMIATAPDAVRETVVSIGWLDGVRARLFPGDPAGHR